MSDDIPGSGSAQGESRGEVRGDTGAGPQMSRKGDYLALNRAFTAGAVAQAVAGLAPDRGDRWRVLDAGTGAGGALPALAALAQITAGTVLAVDQDPEAVAAAGDVAAGLGSGVEVRVADLREVTRAAATTGELFDVIWAADVVWPASFEDPATVTAELAAALAPGGKLGLFTSNYYQSMFLPGHSRLERLIRTASELTWGLPSDGPTHYERLGAWMRHAGLEQVTLTVFPITGTLNEPLARAYLEQIVWPEMLHAVTSHGHAAGMTPADIARAHNLLTPTHPSYAGHHPGGYLVAPTLLWTGTAPDRP